MADDVYRLYYWPGLPGRGEYVRLVLEEANVPYVDVARRPESEGGGVPALRRVLKGELGGVIPFAPPVLQHGSLVIAQTTNICRYLGRRHGLWPQSEEMDAVALQLQLTVADLVAEVHDTHHPISTTLSFEEQEDAAEAAAAAFRDHRISKFLGWFERVLKANGGTWMVGDRHTAVDLSVFQTMLGLHYAFPRAFERLSPTIPSLLSLQERVSALPNVAAYLSSGRRLGFTEQGIFRRYPQLDG